MAKGLENADTIPIDTLRILVEGGCYPVKATYNDSVAKGAAYVYMKDQQGFLWGTQKPDETAKLIVAKKLQKP